MHHYQAQSEEMPPPAISSVSHRDWHGAIQARRHYNLSNCLFTVCDCGKKHVLLMLCGSLWWADTIVVQGVNWYVVIYF